MTAPAKTAQEMSPFVRIALYYLAGRLGAAGLPPEAVSIITDDPVLLGVITNLASVAMVGVVMLWWRIAKRFGWAT